MQSGPQSSQFLRSGYSDLCRVCEDGARLPYMPLEVLRGIKNVRDSIQIIVIRLDPDVTVILFFTCYLTVRGL